ncbi:MAG: hypothetical protein RLY14_2564 [Planctomycetota bacterium]|jgi:nicotinamidase/pyrazinamidase
MGRLGTEGKRALLLIDLQNDFVEGGALSVPAGREVMEVANRLIPHFEMVVATLDWHPRNHRSFASCNEGVQPYENFLLNGLPQTAWPDHCIAHTSGADFVKGLNLNGIHHIVHKGTDAEIDSYSGFYDNGHRKSTGLADDLRQAQVSDVFIMGLATDYCVLFTALDAVREGFKTCVITDGCRGVGIRPGDIARAFQFMREAGVGLIESAELLREKKGTTR